MCVNVNQINIWMNMKNVSNHHADRIQGLSCAYAYAPWLMEIIEYPWDLLSKPDTSHVKDLLANTDQTAEGKNIWLHSLKAHHVLSDSKTQE